MKNPGPSLVVHISLFLHQPKLCWPPSMNIMVKGSNMAMILLCCCCNKVCAHNLSKCQCFVPIIYILPLPKVSISTAVLTLGLLSTLVPLLCQRFSPSVIEANVKLTGISCVLYLHCSYD